MNYSSYITMEENEYDNSRNFIESEMSYKKRNGVHNTVLQKPYCTIKSNCEENLSYLSILRKNKRKRSKSINFAFYIDWDMM